MPIRLRREPTSKSKSATPATGPGSKPLAAGKSPPATVHRAPDGMEINADIAAPKPLGRAQVLATAKTADVPQRVQIGPTCGLYALGMVMDMWHRRDAKNPTALVRDDDLLGRGWQYTLTPTTDERLLDYAQRAGFTAKGEMFTARQLAQVAAHFGYTASVHDNATLEDIYRVLAKGHAALVAFDVDRNGNPGDFGGQRAHYAVIEGAFEQHGEWYLIAKHGWGVQTDHVWRARDFDASWKALATTDFYGTPGDGVIPDEPRLREPHALDLPDAGGGRADIRRSLATKIVEIVPRGERPAGGDIVAAPH